MSFINVQHLKKSYKSVTAVDDFSFQVEKGEIYALVGPDGAGKTSIMRMLCNLIEADQGTATIGDIDIFKNFEKVKPLLGYMPQVFSLYPDLSVEENLVFYAGIFGVTGDEYIKRRERMYEFSRLKPFADRRAQDLSGGMKQKLALSCALMHDPKLLLLDEPTTGVDPLSRQQFWEILLQLKQEQVTIIVATPYMDEVARTDHACFIMNGRKLAEGKPEELVRIFRGQVFYLDITPKVSLLEQLNATPGLSARRFGAGLHLYLEPGDTIDKYHDTLTHMGIPPESIRPITPDLEDCFIQLMETEV